MYAKLNRKDCILDLSKKEKEGYELLTIIDSEEEAIVSAHLYKLVKANISKPFLFKNLMFTSLYTSHTRIVSYKDTIKELKAKRSKLLADCKNYSEVGALSSKINYLTDLLDSEIVNYSKLENLYV